MGGKDFMLYQVVESNKNIFNAGSKATSDITLIAEKMNFKPLYVHPIEAKNNILSKLVNQTRYFFEWSKLYKKVADNSVILLQHPFRNRQCNREKSILKLKERKNIKVISLIHDIEELRNSVYNEHYRSEFEFMVRVADQSIVHNSKMKEWLKDKGVSESKIVILEIFDYLSDSPNNEKNFANNIIIAGNLDSSKSAYLGEIQNVSNLNFDLYGVNYKNNASPNIAYHGAFKPEELSEQFTSGFGLVWDGTSIDTCDGNTGNYLRYNNPHKLSLYISSGVPVVIWKQAALATFVQEKGIGLCVDSLTECAELISNMSKDQYDEMCSRVNEESIKLRSGFYSKKALEEALRRIQNI